MPVPESAIPLTEPCPACTVWIDVSGVEPWTAVGCPACGEAVRVRCAFHHFTLTREVGSGGMSKVFGARDESLGRDLALKILRSGLSQDDKRLRQFEKEAWITASISHPNVVKVYTAGRDQGYFYMAMELVEGGSLDEKIRKKGRLPEAWVLELAEQVVQGLKAASEAGLIHRDIKPGNILLSREGTPKIVDFGLAVFARDGVEDAEIWATPFYVPPETLHGEPEDFRSDIYALGSSLYHALMGKPLFDVDTNSLAELKALKARPADLREATAALSQETVAMLTRTLKRRPAERYNSYEEFLDHLRYARRRLRRGGRGVPWPGRQGRSPWQIAGIAAALAGMGGLGWQLLRNQPGAGDGTDSGLQADRDPTLGTDGSISSQFLQARNTLFSGDPAQGRKQFEILAGNSGIRQPTLNWARYNAGLAALLEGELEAAGKTFGVIAGSGSFSNAPEDQPTAQFFLASASALSGDRPVSTGQLPQYPPGTVHAIGLLAAGLKNWHLGDLPGTIAYLKAFSASTPPRSAAWIDRYKQVAQKYLQEAVMLEGLPGIPVREPTPEAATQRLIAAREALGRSSLHGALRVAAETQLTAYAAAIEALKEARNLTQEGELAVKAAAEIERLQQVEQTAAPLGLALQFGEGAALIRQCRAESPRGREVIADHLRWWENADSFLDLLLHDLTVPVEGALVAADGPGTALRGSIRSQERMIRIKPANGPELSLPPSKWTPTSLAALAEKLLERTADSDQYYRRREMLVAFALRSGLKTYARVAGRELAREHPVFRSRWSRTGTLR